MAVLVSFVAILVVAVLVCGRFGCNSLVRPEMLPGSRRVDSRHYLYFFLWNHAHLFCFGVKPSKMSLYVVMTDVAVDNRERWS